MSEDDQVVISLLIRHSMEPVANFAQDEWASTAVFDSLS